MFFFPKNKFAVGRGSEILQIIKWLTQFVQDASEIVLIAAVAWTVMRIKDRAILFVEKKVFGNKENISYLTNSVRFLTNCIIYGCALLASLSTCGFNMTPVIASVGASSVIIGIAAQKILMNVASSFALFASPPFARGDKVKFFNNGAIIQQGMVVEIEPLRTVLRTLEGSTLYISNSKVTGWEIQNDSLQIAIEEKEEAS